ncbi:hypothetical protein [Pseudoduganella aquatica]|uniref:Uncharacterized protein n=1 Tax=Pseudoduganella aquatica TaxID=2660641 RepID=A0A7X4HDY0_9BURK|nr:hypothetical protein [Pseudoduganella aquatica]MYN08782.1 hypothetical protein [Pseudoduganella aquatica]
MAIWPSAMQVVLGLPIVENLGGELVVIPEIINAGGAAIHHLMCHDITLGCARRLGPPHGYPVVLGDLERSGVARIRATFAGVGMLAGAQYLLTLRGSYTVDGISFPLALTRYVQLPAPTADAPRRLRARVASAVCTDFWNYELINEEDAGSGLDIVSFTLGMAAPITVTGIPLGWTMETDSLSFVRWSVLAQDQGAAGRIAPGRSASGFQLMSPHTRSEATLSTLAAWDQAAHGPGPVVEDYAVVPYRYGM